MKYILLFPRVKTQNEETRDFSSVERVGVGEVYPAQFEEGFIWGAVDTRSLTGEGVLNGEFESFGAFLWGPNRTIIV